MSTWKNDQKEKLEKIVQSHPVFAAVQNLCVIVVPLPASIIKTIAAFLGEFSIFENVVKKRRSDICVLIQLFL